MIKAKYYHKGNVVGTVKFSHDRDYQPIDEQDIIAAAPAKWDSCCWDHGERVAPRRKRATTVEEIVAEPVISEDE